jgi:hypothetical protein
VSGPDRAAIGRRNRKAGEEAEELVADRMRALGMLCVERIKTGFRVRRAPAIPHCGGRTKIVGASPTGRVMGDFRAVVPGGRAVLVEVKRRPDRLRWSNLKNHQRAALDAYRQAGALALLAWVHARGLAVMRWPLPACLFRKGASLSPQDADALNIGAITTTSRKEGNE